jgi:hypothetical protein
MLTQVIPEFFGNRIVFREQLMNLWASPVPPHCRDFNN